MAREYHVVAVGGSNENEVSVDLGDILNTLGAQDWELNVAVPLKDSDTLLLILSRAKPSARKTPASWASNRTRMVGRFVAYPSRSSPLVTDAGEPGAGLEPATVRLQIGGSTS